MYIFDISLMLNYELLTHDEHATTSTSRVVDPPPVGFDHLHHEFYDRFWGIELSSLFPLSIREFSEEIFIDSSEEIFGIVVFSFEFDIRDDIDEFTKRGFIEIWLTVDL